MPVHAPVAQLDRTLPSGGRGLGFEPSAEGASSMRSTAEGGKPAKAGAVNPFGHGAQAPRSRGYNLNA